MKGQEIRAIRKKLGISQAELGKHLGVTQAAVSDWERGINPLNAENIKAITKLKGDFERKQRQQYGNAGDSWSLANLKAAIEELNPLELAEISQFCTVQLVSRIESAPSWCLKGLESDKIEVSTVPKRGESVTRISTLINESIRINGLSEEQIKEQIRLSLRFIPNISFTEEEWEKIKTGESICKDEEAFYQVFSIVDRGFNAFTYEEWFDAFEQDKASNHSEENNGNGISNGV